MQTLEAGSADNVHAGLPLVSLDKVKSMPLETEQAVYARELPNLLSQAGKFVVIGGEHVVGVFDTYDDALKVGYDKFGLKPFLVKQIDLVDRVHFFTRDLGVMA